MKLFFNVLIAFLLLAGAAFGQTWHTANQVTVAWDEVTMLSDGSPLPVGNSITYRVYLSNAVTDPDKTNPAFIEEVSVSEYTFTFTEEGKYFVGLEAVRYDGTEEVGVSELLFSDNVELAPDPFGLRYYIAPANPGNLSPR